MSSAKQISGFEDLLHCMICFDAFQSPKMLKCGHTFCADCLQGYLTTYQQQRRSHPGKLPCPTCRDLTTLPGNGISGLRNDFKVQKIEEMFRTVNLKEMRDRSRGKVCDACRVLKKKSVGEYYCRDCCMSYCSGCKEKHNKNPVFKNHKVFSEEKPSSSSKKDFDCTVHTTEKAAFFCTTCETVICTVCIMSQHDGHDITDLSNVFQQHQKDIDNLQSILNNKMQNLKSKREELENLRQLNMRSCQQAEIQIKEKTREIIENAKTQEQALLEDLRKKRDEKLRQLHKANEACGYHIAKASSLKDFAVSTVKKNSLRRLAIHEELIQRMRTATDFDNSGLNKDIKTVVSFLPSRHEVSVGRIEEVKGEMDKLSRQYSAVSGGPSVRLRSGSVPNILSFTKPQLLFEVKRVGNSLGEIRDPLGVACLLNGDIVVTEWGNKRIQIFDSVGKPVCLIASGKIGPQGVAVTLKGNIMVTDAHHKRLEVFTQTGNSLAKWGLGKFFSPCAIAVCPNGNCVITDLAEHTVSIYRGESKCLKQMGGKGSTDDKFNNPLYVTSGHHSEIIVSDSDNHCVKIFSSSGKFVCKFGGEGDGEGRLRFPRGVIVDNDGNILVADRNNDRICQFSPEGRYIRTVLDRKDGIKEPYGLAMSLTRNLIITESSVDRAALKMYQI